MDLSNSDGQSSVPRASFSSIPSSKVEDRHTQAGAGSTLVASETKPASPQYKFSDASGECSGNSVSVQ